jgi:hypothetical protein
MCAKMGIVLLGAAAICNLKKALQNLTGVGLCPYTTDLFPRI